jgi:HAD superfamily hydrolase (TIGR01548 family)
MMMKPQAVLFDMDDTLIDTTRSYRASTLATADFFGVELSSADIAAAKAAGNANNDWAMTQRLLWERGVEVSLAEVTRVFEEFYQGTDSRAGLRLQESLLVEVDFLRRLAGRLKLGIVTGRPHRDAVRLLQEQGIEELFGAVVTMDDAPLKPDPAPVRLACERLGVQRAWMVGDTPDDMRSACAAGVLALGVIAPGDDPALARTALLAAGAARVLSKLTELEELLP